MDNFTIMKIKKFFQKMREEIALQLSSTLDQKTGIAQLQRVMVHSLLVMAFVTASFFSANATKHIITAQNFNFNPSTLDNVHIGDTIRWNWVKGNHTTTSVTIPVGAATWDWPLNDTSLFFEYVPTVSGVYDYHCMHHFNLGMTGTFTVLSSSGITNSTSQNELAVFPNPCFDNLTVQFANGNSSLKVLKIYNNMGKLLLEIPFEYTAGENQRIFNIPELVGRGFIYLEFIDDTKNAYTRKVFRL